MTAPAAPRVFMIDNYDSFTYNLVQYLGELGAEITVRRNDHVTIAEIAAARPTHLVVSPGPCTPNEAGISMEAIAHFGAERLPVLGVCLGHQAIGQVYGGVVHRTGAPVPGKTDEISHDGRGVFAGLPDPFTATRYHSLVVDTALPDCLELTAWNAAPTSWLVRTTMPRFCWGSRVTSETMPCSPPVWETLSWPR